MLNLSIHRIYALANRNMDMNITEESWIPSYYCVRKYLISTGHFNYIPSPFISAHHFKRVSPHISIISYLGTKNINRASSHIYIAVYLGSAYQKQITLYLTSSAMQWHQTSKYHGILSHRVLRVEKYLNSSSDKCP